jgi:type II secretory pathway pseudopilin PulG
VIDFKKRKDASGFTIIEAMISMAVLAFGILGVASLQITTLKRTSTSRYSLEASQVAKNQMSQIRRLPWNALVETSNAGADWELLCPTIVPGGACIGGVVGDSGYPGAFPATLPTVGVTQTGVDGTVFNLVSYQVEWRVQEVVGAAPAPKECRKDVFLRITWREQAMQAGAGGPLREYYLSTRMFNNLGDRNADGADLNIADTALSVGC